MQVFGSFATGLFLPTSDMDLVVTGSGCGNVAQGLRALAQAFTRKGLVKNVQVRAPPPPPFPCRDPSHPVNLVLHAPL